MQGNWIQEVKNIDLFDCKEFKPDCMTETKMRPGYVAVLYHPKQSEIIEFHEEICISCIPFWKNPIPKMKTACLNL